ncbi:conserved hypothetical protein [Nostocoides japonicum T1-X7]|uniref:Glycosyltransferase n=1 Tax=Nostocoides japonicum T1-X7 TaxID=1194083 RepID=A0A077LUC2_9MICO|nr:hypothetical protein [Tetrasphaera japonica]CCH76192.1 conserved hypothetical protein [Tetrasphaera japonica T1-X7]
MRRGDLERTREEQWCQIRGYLLAYADHAPPRKVAVVGNAPLEPHEERVAEIDSADLVIRVNSLMLDDPGAPPTLGTACHAVVLSRATALTPWVLRDYRRRAYLVPQAGFVQYRPGDTIGLLLHADFWPPDLGAMPLPNAVVKARAVRALDPGARPGSLIPTTGTTAVFLAHEMFPDADLVVVGFSFLDDAEQTSWSHHSGGHTKVNWQHRLDLEARLLRSWIDDGSARALP